MKYALRILVRVIAIIAGLLLFMTVLSKLMNVPGHNRIERYLSYESLQEMAAAETNEIRRIIPFYQDGSNFTAVVAGICRWPASGPAVLIYDQDGTRIDCCRDIGDLGYESGRSHKEWKFWPYEICGKGGVIYYGRKVSAGRAIYFLLVHRNCAGEEDDVVQGPLFDSEEEIRQYVKKLKPNLELKRCPCGCWSDSSSLVHILDERPEGRLR